MRTAINPNYWRNLFMKVLEAQYHEEGHWGREHWVKYGIQQDDIERIEQQFSAQLRWREEQKEVVFED